MASEKLNDFKDEKEEATTPSTCAGPGLGKCYFSQLANAKV